jgi:hypothetical protein
MDTKRNDTLVFRPMDNNIPPLSSKIDKKANATANKEDKKST